MLLPQDPGYQWVFLSVDPSHTACDIRERGGGGGGGGGGEGGKECKCKMATRKKVQFSKLRHTLTFKVTRQVR